MLTDSEHIVTARSVGCKVKLSFYRSVLWTSVLLSVSFHLRCTKPELMVVLKKWKRRLTYRNISQDNTVDAIVGVPACFTLSEKWFVFSYWVRTNQANTFMHVRHSVFKSSLSARSSGVRMWKGLMSDYSKLLQRATDAPPDALLGAAELNWVPTKLK